MLVIFVPHKQRSALKTEADSRTEVKSVTELTSHAEMSVANLVAPLKVPNKFLTFPIDHPSRPLPLKDVANRNMKDMLVAAATFHFERSASKLDASLNMSSKSVTLLTSQFPTPVPAKTAAPSNAKAMVVTSDVTQFDTS